MIDNKPVLRKHRICLFLFSLCLYSCILSCKKDRGNNGSSAVDTSLSFTVNGVYNGTLDYHGLNTKPAVEFNFTEPINSRSLENDIRLTNAAGTNILLTYSLQNGDRTLTVTPKNELASFTAYSLVVSNSLITSTGGRLINPVSIDLITGLDGKDKFPRISDDQLLDLLEKQTFKYFWDFGHLVSGLARERNTSGDVVTTGGSGFGIMAVVTAISRDFISRAEGLARMQKILAFLKTADRFHGAFPHWLNGSTGKIIPFSTKDNGADLVETSYLMQGLLTARQYFNGAGAAETALRKDINDLYQAVEWSWFRKDDEDVLYWHWSPEYNWDMDMPVHGWDEALITYVMAASSPTYPIPKSVYDNGWAQNGAMKNGNTYYGVQLPLGPANGGPLFFEHYSFLGINPNGLSDAYANYESQVKAHTLINYNYCKTNPKNYYGYSDSCWGLTASDDINGYLAHEPNNDDGVISPTAALSSMPYTPKESMQALKFFYYKLGDKIWKDYGFVDAFSLKDTWFADSFLAIDQGPAIVMTENYRSGLLWNLFMSCPEVKTGMKKLGFSGPGL